MRHISHKTADLIMDHDYENDGPLHLYGGNQEEFESVLNYVSREARIHKTRLRMKWNRGYVVISKA